MSIRTYEPIDYEAVTVSNTAIGLTQAKLEKASKAEITVESAQIRVRTDGTDPTASEGHLVDAGESVELTGKELTNFAAIRTGSTDATLRVTYLR